MDVEKPVGLLINPDQQMRRRTASPTGPVTARYWLAPMKDRLQPAITSSVEQETIFLDHLLPLVTTTLRLRSADVTRLFGSGRMAA